MKYLGNTEQSSATPVIEIGQKYWMLSRMTNKATLEQCVASPFSTKHGCFDFQRLPFERFDVFGPATDDKQPDFNILLKEHYVGK